MPLAVLVVHSRHLDLSRHKRAHLGLHPSFLRPVALEHDPIHLGHSVCDLAPRLFLPLAQRRFRLGPHHYGRERERLFVILLQPTPQYLFQLFSLLLLFCRRFRRVFRLVRAFADVVLVFTVRKRLRRLSPGSLFCYRLRRGTSAHLSALSAGVSRIGLHTRC